MDRRPPISTTTSTLFPHPTRYRAARFALLVVYRGEDGRVLAGEVATLLVQVHLAGNQVHHALQALAHADRPGYRRALDAEHAFDFIEQVDRVAAFAVELVDEGHDRRVAHAAHLHQLDRALLDALGHVDDHQRRVHRGRSEEHTSELQSLMRIS